MSHPNAFADVSTACREVTSSVAASVVQVHGRPRRPASALVVAAERVLTTNHSVEWEEDISVKLADGRTLVGSVAGRDAATDLVLLRVPGLDAPAASFSADTPDTGQLGLIVGRTWGGHLRARLTTLTRIEGPVRIGSGRTLERVLSLDAGPYPGFSGSAVVLPDGHIAGLATAGILRGTGLAVPAATLSATIEGLERHGSVRRGYLGITSQPVQIPETQRAGRDQSHGLLVLGLAENGPAATAGVMVGDILVAFDGEGIEDPEHLLARLSGDRIGQTVPLTAIRGRSLSDVPVVIAERPARG